MSSDIVVSGAALPLTEPAQAAFNQDLVNMLFANAPGGTPVPVFHRFLELSARYQLDASANEIWLAAMGGRNGRGGSVVVLVGRDGYLKIARRDPAFIDVDADVVYSEDEFKVVRKADGTRTVEHSYGNPAQRGDAMGAYAVLRREGKPDRYFYAPLAQYAKSADASAWKYRDAMIVKCAQSYIARTTYGVSGPIPFDELNSGLALPSDGQAIETTARDASAEMPPELSMLVARAYAVDSKSWRPNEVLARLPEPEDKNFDATVKQLAAELEAWLVENEPTYAVVVTDPADVPDPAAECQHRWDTDEAWRALVQPALSRYFDAEAALEEAIAGDQGEDAARQRNQIEAVGAELYSLGVPAGWYPESAADQS